MTNTVLKEVKEIPTSGRFHLVWSVDEMIPDKALFGDTYKWENGNLMIYEDNTGWVNAEPDELDWMGRCKHKHIFVAE